MSQEIQLPGNFDLILADFAEIGQITANLVQIGRSVSKSGKMASSGQHRATFWPAGISAPRATCSATLGQPRSSLQPLGVIFREVWRASFPQRLGDLNFSARIDFCMNGDISTLGITRARTMGSVGSCALGGRVGANSTQGVARSSHGVVESVEASAARR